MAQPPHANPTLRAIQASPFFLRVAGWLRHRLSEGAPVPPVAAGIASSASAEDGLPIDFTSKTLTDDPWLHAVQVYQSALCALVANAPGASEQAWALARELGRLDRLDRLVGCESAHDTLR